MEPFTRLTGVAVPIDEPNVDTNQLCPTRFNKVPRGPGHAKILFHDRRFNLDGTEKEHILNVEPFNQARIVVADRNWGCGSSRESAVYALYEFGIRCVIASSFGDIHANNCAKTAYCRWSCRRRMSSRGDASFMTSRAPPSRWISQARPSTDPTANSMDSTSIPCARS